MPGIKACGVYIPFHRLSREAFSKAWGGALLKGEKAIANYDEDSITMAIEAGRECLQGVNRQTVDGLFFASTTSPYQEKQSAALIAKVLDLKRGIFTADFTNSLRAGTNALRAALDSVQAGSAQNVLVVAADCRLGAPGSDFEKNFGDGAAALLISDTGSVTVQSSYTHANEIIDQWRTNEQRFIKAWEDRFVVTEGYLANVREAVSAFLKQTASTIKDFNKVALYAPDARRHQEACRTLKIDPREQAQNPMFDSVGNTGTASALITLVSALEEAAVNDKILLINYGDGCDIFAFQVQQQMARDKNHKGVQRYLASKKVVTNYDQYIRMAKLMEVEVGRRRPPAVSSAALLHREKNMVLALHGSECTNCGRAFFPPQRVCLYCLAKDQFKEISLSEQKGTLFTFSKDFVAQTIDPPVTTIVVELEGGLRFFGQMTDRDHEEVKLGMPLEFTFRKMYEAEGYHNYYWKCRPVR